MTCHRPGFGIGGIGGLPFTIRSPTASMPRPPTCNSVRYSVHATCTYDSFPAFPATLIRVFWPRARRVSTLRISPVTRTGHAWITGAVVDLMP